MQFDVDIRLYEYWHEQVFWNFLSCYHAINTQDEYIQLSRLIDLLTWAPSCLVYSNCHNSALNYNIHLSNYSKVKKNVLIEIIMIYTF